MTSAKPPTDGVGHAPLLDEAGAVRRNHRGKRLFAYECPHLEHYPLGTPYPEIVQRVKRLLEHPLGPARTWRSTRPASAGPWLT